MQGVVSAAWQQYGPPLTHHVGDLSWRRFLHGDVASRTATRLWDADGDLIAWGWLTLPDELELFFAPGWRREAIVRDVLSWADERAAAAVKVDTLTTDKPWQSLLGGLGLVPDEQDALWYHVAAIGTAPPPPRLPAGYRVRHVRLPDDLERRVAVHRAAFGEPGRPSRVTSETYAAVTRAWPYREELDLVVEAPDGSFAAGCIAWIDEAGAAGLLEPVGAHPDHRRLGLARAVCTAALRSLHAAGARTAIVCAETDAARALYRSVGFVERGRYTWFRRPGA
jgi:ribosomal protein S18 acetylase RimI-like enzyme